MIWRNDALPVFITLELLINRSTILTFIILLDWIEMYLALNSWYQTKRDEYFEFVDISLPPIDAVWGGAESGQQAE